MQMTPYIVIPGLTRNPAMETTARKARHWIPACAGMTRILINHSRTSA